MTSYRMPLSDKQRKIGRAVYRAQRNVARVLIEMKAETGITQQALAEKLGIDRSVVNRRLTGRANLTLRSLAELAWAFDRDLVVDFARPEENAAVAAQDASARQSWMQIEPRHGPAELFGGSALFDPDRLMALLRDRTVDFSSPAISGNDNDWQQMNDALKAA